MFGDMFKVKKSQGSKVKRYQAVIALIVYSFDIKLSQLTWTVIRLSFPAVTSW